MSVTQQSIEDRISASLAPEAPQAQQEPQEAPDDAVPDEEVIEAPEDEAPPMAAESDEAVSDDDENVVSMETINDMAEYLGIDPSEMYNLQAAIQMPDGTRKQMRIGEWKDTMYSNEEAKIASREAREAATKYTKRLEQFESEIEQYNARQTNIMNIAVQELMRDFQGIDWQTMQRDDPGRYAALRQNYMERNAQLQQAAAHADHYLKQQREALEAQKRESNIQKLAAESRAVLEAIPAWKDEKVAAVEKPKMANYLKSIGFSDDDVNGLSDHRLVVLAHKAMWADEQRGKADAAKKKVLKIGKSVLKPGARRGKAEQKMDREKQLRSQLKESRGAVDAAAALIQHRLGR